MPHGIDEELETHDIYLAAYLKVTGCVLVRKRKQGPRVFFIFSNPGGSIKDMREAYFNGQGTVQAHQFATTITAMKQLLFE